MEEGNDTSVGSGAQWATEARFSGIREIMQEMNAQTQRRRENQDSMSADFLSRRLGVSAFIPLSDLGNIRAPIRL
jgi:hypothetical protein